MTCAAISCTSQSKKLQIEFNIPSFVIGNGDTSKADYYNQKLNIYYQDSLILYKLSEHKEGRTDTLLPNTESYILSKIQYLNCLFYKYVSPSKYEVSLFKADSLLLIYGLANNFTEPDLKLYAKKSITHEGSLLNTFVLTDTSNHLNYDTLIYTFKKNKSSINYSIAKQLDSIYNQQLVSIQLIHRRKYFPEKESVVPISETLISIKEIMITEQEKDIIDKKLLALRKLKDFN